MSRQDAGELEAQALPAQPQGTPYKILASHVCWGIGTWDRLATTANNVGKEGGGCDWTFLQELQWPTARGKILKIHSRQRMAGATHGGPNAIRVRGMSETGSSLETDTALWVPATGQGGCPSGTESLPGNEDVLIVDHGGAP